jgi:hypothetical protein
MSLTAGRRFGAFLFAMVFLLAGCGAHGGERPDAKPGTGGYPPSGLGSGTKPTLTEPEINTGGDPASSGGMSCEEARARYIASHKGSPTPPDLTENRNGRVLNGGWYLHPCNVPISMGISICAAIQDGRAVGVTVTINPPNPEIQSCVDRAVWGLFFQSHPGMDVTVARFDARFDL